MPDFYYQYGKGAYQGVLDSLLYASQGTRYYLCRAYTVIKFNQNPGKAVKRILRYLKSTTKATFVLIGTVIPIVDNLVLAMYFQQRWRFYNVEFPEEPKLKFCNQIVSSQFCH